jgi:hypothetical protein
VNGYCNEGDKESIDKMARDLKMVEVHVSTIHPISVDYDLDYINSSVCPITVFEYDICAEVQHFCGPILKS